MLRDLGRVLSLWRAQAGWLVLGIAVSAGSTLLGMALLALAGQGIAAALGGAALGGGLAFLLLRPLVLLRPAARWTERMVTHAATFRALADTRIWFFRRLAERLPAGIGLGRSGDLLGRLVSDVDALDGLYLRAMVPALSALAVVAVAAALLAGAPLLAAAVALPLAVALLLPLLLAPGAARSASRAATAQGRLRAAAIDPLLGVEDVLAANAEAAARDALARDGEALARAQRGLGLRAAWAGATGTLLVQVALLGALAWGLATGAGGAALAVLGLFLAVAAAESLGLLPRAGIALAGAAAGARRLFELADAPPPVAEPAQPAGEPAGHAIRVEGLRFAWSADRAPVFEDLDLDIPEGTRLALLGPSGIGKSSFAALLLKLAAPQAGRITLGGVDIADLPAEVLRRRIACLTQDARLFDDSIAANLRIAAPRAPEAALWRALDRAGIGELVRALPEGLETRCGEGGARFSGGQARRLALARVLLSAAPVLVLDEPTAGLDAETERAFLETLEQVTPGRTVILITHRLVGVEKPTRILRLAGGRALPAAG
ncbi:thiol reductant ABC exporter subunit CydC [Paracraurococcus lichenis]|uniref:Thiol reductant ABC exporter subunit CydC n=1 Tax=Paracraurococcus lichenis TaxID=3064888 RepID=A0ABT9DWX7_9PROT|nr:thiol reductant ABC exporter subunit CydC [Paracraurococcus sp. LOR1-02]MDO9708399.1 thiol reductant ABC exporter subunit CydC [Paracraurococcus sp. LOR1-02]